MTCIWRKFYCKFVFLSLLLGTNASNDIYIYILYIYTYVYYIIDTTYPWGLYLICKCNHREWSIYKLDTNQMNVLQLFCFMMHKRIKGALSFCLAWKMILYCWSCVVEWCRWFSWWKALDSHDLDSHAISRNRFTILNRVIFLALGLSTNILLILLIS